MANADELQVVEDTSVEETIDTSTNDDSDEPDNLEDIELTPEELEEMAKNEDENKDTEPAKSEEDEDSEETDEEDSEETDEPELSDEEKRKLFNQEMAARRVEEKRLREQNIQERQQEYVAQAEDDRDLAVRQLQIDAYNNKVEANTNKLTNGYERAIKDFSILGSDDPAIKAEVDAAIDAFQAQYVSVDDFGNASEIRGDLYQHLQSKADSISRLVGIHETNKAASKAKEKSKVFTPPSKAPKTPKSDPDLDAFDEEAYRKY